MLRFSEMVCSRAFPLAFAYCIFDSLLKKSRKKIIFLGSQHSIALTIVSFQNEVITLIVEIHFD